MCRCTSTSIICPQVLFSPVPKNVYSCRFIIHMWAKINVVWFLYLHTMLFIFCSVCRYRDGTSQEDSVVQWLWQTLESFTVEERVLFLRFVSGRSRLPTRVSEIPQRFQISVSSGQVNILQSLQIEWLQAPGYGQTFMISTLLKKSLYLQNFYKILSYWLLHDIVM